MNLAEKYRPTNLNEVIMNSVLRTMLQTIIENNNLATSYLFYGSAGSGKTSTAKIFANSFEAEIIELDAASNNKVDDARSINELCKYAPVNHKHRIIILDEAHRLTEQAWDALLKTLEECKTTTFIFCTTNYAKIPETIISRCFEVKFPKVNSENIEQLIMKIIKLETNNSEINTDHIRTLAKRSQGNVRKAINDLQKYIESGMKNINSPTECKAMELIENIKKRNLTKIKSLVMNENNTSQLIEDMINICIDNLYVSYVHTTELNKASIDRETSRTLHSNLLEVLMKISSSTYCIEDYKVILLGEIYFLLA